MSISISNIEPEIDLQFCNDADYILGSSLLGQTILSEQSQILLMADINWCMDNGYVPPPIYSHPESELGNITK